MQSLFEILMLLLNLVWFLIIAHVIISWLVTFQVLNLHQPIVMQIWTGLNRMLEPIYGRIRSVLPTANTGIDFAPLIALLGVIIARIVLINNANLFF